MCHVSLSLALSLARSLSPLLHFVLKFSIQKIKGGEKRRASDRASKGKRTGGGKREREKRKVPSWISS